MKYEFQKGDVLDLTAPYDVNVANADLGYVPCFLVGKIVAGAVTNAASGTAIEGLVAGVLTVKKNSAEAWTQGVTLYWDDTNKQFTTTSTSNTKAGYAVAAAANPSGTGIIRLCPGIGA